MPLFTEHSHLPASPRNEHAWNQSLYQANA